MLAAGALKRRNSDKQSLILSDELARLKAPSVDDFSDPPGGHDYWLERRADWRRAASNSLLLSLSRHCVEIASPDPKRSNTALLAYTLKTSGLPPMVCDLMTDFLKRYDPELRSLFLRTLDQ